MSSVLTKNEKPPKAMYLYEVKYAVWEGERLSSLIDTRFIAASSQAGAVSCVRQKLYLADPNMEIEIKDVIDRLPVDYIAYGSI